MKRTGLLQEYLHTKARHRKMLRAGTTAEDLGTRISDIRARWGDRISDNGAKPIFIFSAGWRSGSTMLQRMLMACPRIMIWGEPYSKASIIQAMAEQVGGFTMEWPDERYVIDAIQGDLTENWVANVYPVFPKFYEAHRQFFETLFAEPAAARGRPQWGLKEVRLGIKHARYLKFLFPQSRFIFLVRNPYDSYASFRSYVHCDFTHWPNGGIGSTSDFAKNWAILAGDFCSNHQSVGGMLVRYEELINEGNVLRCLSEFVGTDLPSPQQISVIRGRNAKNKISSLSMLEQYLITKHAGHVYRAIYGAR
jgi:hypothetical protein